MGDRSIYWLFGCGFLVAACGEPAVGAGQSGETEGDTASDDGPGAETSTGRDEASGSDESSGSASDSDTDGDTDTDTDDGTDTDDPPVDGGEQQWLTRLDASLVAVASDGDHILVATASFPGGAVIRLDAADGVVIDELPLDVVPTDIAVLGDGRFAVSATIDADAWIGWFDADGGLEHEASFDGPAAGWDTGDALAVRDGALFFLSRETVDSDAILDGALRVVRRFDDFDEAFRVEVGEPGSHSVLSTAFAPTSDGGFAAVGRTFTGANEAELTVNHFDATGALDWEVTIPSSATLEQPTPLAMAAGADDRLAIAGFANWVYDFNNGFIGHDAALLLLDADGVPQHELALAPAPAWAPMIEHNIAHALFSDVVIDGAGQITVVGEITEAVIHNDDTELDYELRHLVLTKYSPAGDEVWTRAYDAELAPLGAPAPSPFLQNVILPEPLGTHGKSLSLAADDELVVGGEQRMLTNDPVSFTAVHAD